MLPADTQLLMIVYMLPAYIQTVNASLSCYPLIQKLLMIVYPADIQNVYHGTY